jgi:hypothetical protein
LRNRLNKSTFEKIICLESWVVFKDKEEIIKKEENKEKSKLLEEDNQFFIIERE